MEEGKRHFYHSFPRPKKSRSKEDVIKLGLEILKGIKKDGLILAPEVVTWTQPLQDGTDRETQIRQHRICFTELSRHELPGHERNFGPFTLEFDIDTLRKAGAVPTIYMPGTVEGDRNYSSLGSTVVTQLGDVKYTIGLLEQLREAATRSQKVTLRNVDDEKNVVREYEMPSADILTILEYIKYRNAPLSLMDGVLALVNNLFYPTDDTRPNGLLRYYRQREWRLVEGPKVKGQSSCRALTQAEKMKLQNGMNGQFWAKKLSDGKEPSRIVDASFIMDKINGKRIADTIAAVIVPAEAYDKAKAIFGDKVQLGEGGKA